MRKELVIQTRDGGVDIALIREGKLLEMHHEDYGGEFQVGDICLGKVRKVAPQMNAVFVDFGAEKPGFLHYHDLGPDIKSLKSFSEGLWSKKVHTHLLSSFKFLPAINKDGKMVDVLEAGDRVPVQIVKEPISTKGHRLTSQLSLPGRFVILLPFSDAVSVSKKIEDREERTRLKDIIKSIKPKGFGVIVRTVAEGKSVTDIDQDLKGLMAKWKETYTNLKDKKKKLYREPQKAELVLRDMLNDSFESVVVDNAALFKELQSFIKDIAPDKHNLLKLHETSGGNTIFGDLGIAKQTQNLLGKIVNIGGGAYLVIEHTEAMHVIDVNSGSKRQKNDSQEESALRTNLAAAEEISRQLRLRDMGGLIIIDFIDMRSVENRRTLQNAMINFMADDRAKHTILPLSKFGLMQITRQRVRPEKQDDEPNVCPLCKGTGNAPPTIHVAEEIELRLKELISSKKPKRVHLSVHPYLEAFLKKGFPSKRMKWILEYKKKVKISSNEKFDITHFEFDID
ncbi:MAG: Rne/Rng family ribonuclease [Bacteroidetes bacterium]|nr:Rne/Rng family ribonuclease [Bacteroidota bacterium]